MKRSIITLAIISISILAASAIAAQNKGRGETRGGVRVGNRADNAMASVTRTMPRTTVARDTNHDGNRSVNPGGVQRGDRGTIGNGQPRRIVDGTSNTMMSRGSIVNGRPQTDRNIRVASGDFNNDNFNRRPRAVNSVVFEGQDEPLWVRGRRNSSVNAVGTSQNVGPDIHGNIRPKGFINTTFDDESYRSDRNGSPRPVQGNQIGTDGNGFYIDDIVIGVSPRTQRRGRSN